MYSQCSLLVYFLNLIMSRRIILGALLLAAPTHGLVRKIDSSNGHGSGDEQVGHLLHRMVAHEGGRGASEAKNSSRDLGTLDPERRLRPGQAGPPAEFKRDSSTNGLHPVDDDGYLAGDESGPGDEFN
jgi:hypothetical protein